MKLPFRAGVLAACLFASGPTWPAPPADFQQQEISRPDGGPWNELVGIAFQANGRAWTWERGGRIWIIDDGSPVTVPALDIGEEVFASGDHGMLGLALHPNFAQTGYVYVAYVVDRHHLLNCDSSQPGAPVCGPGYDPGVTETLRPATIGRITRYRAIRADGDSDYSRARVLDPASRKVLLGETPQAGCPILYVSHGIGTLAFGEDGTLLAGCGDGATHREADTGSVADTYYTEALASGIIRPQENVGAYRAQMVNSHSGKILRLDPETGDGVASNPFFDPAAPRAPRSRMWVLGLRNPFRFTVRPHTGDHDPAAARPGVLYIGDVGWRTREELDIAHSPAQNFGWPAFEGMTSQFGYASADTSNQDAPNPLFGSGGCTQQYFTFQNLIRQDTLASPLSFPNPCNSSVQVPLAVPTFLHQRPAIDWRHEMDEARWAAFNGNTAEQPLIGQSNTEGTWIVTGSQFQGSTSTGGIWYTGTQFPEQYRNTYFHADYEAMWIRNLEFTATDTPRSVSVFDPAAGGVVAMAEHPDGSLYYVSWTAFLRKVYYAPGGNRPPVAHASTDTNHGPAPLAVQFTGSQSSDPDGDPLTYRWNFGDGSAESTEANPAHVFTGSGPLSRAVTLTVTDPAGLDSVATLLVTPNNTPPEVEIASPVDGYLYSMQAEEVIPLTASLDDEESGAGALSCSWHRVFHHNNHTHSEPVVNSCSTTLVTSPIGCQQEIYFYRVHLTVTDPHGLSVTRTATLYPDCSGINLPPVARDDNASVDHGESVMINVLANDSDDGGIDVTSVLVTLAPQHGATSVNPVTGIVTYTHSGGGSGSDSFEYVVRDTAGADSLAATVTIAINPPDEVAPSVPGGLDADAESPIQIALTWNAVTDTGGSGLAGYRVYRDGGATPIAQVTNGTSYTDTGLTANTAYSYEVSAYDQAGNESARSAAAQATTQVASAGPTIRINAGSGNFTDSQGRLWVSDAGYYNTGTSATAGSSVQIANTVDDALYRSGRWDAATSPQMTYSVPVPNGSYEVRLHFAETDTRRFSVGARVFDVLVEGALALDNLDIFAEVGARAALVKTVNTTVTDGQVTIVFVYGVTQPFIRAIEVIGH